MQYKCGQWATITNNLSDKYITYILLYGRGFFVQYTTYILVYTVYTSTNVCGTYTKCKVIYGLAY